MNRYTWTEALDSEGSAQMKYLREFMDASQVMTCLPAQELLVKDPGKEDILEEHIQSCISPDGETLLVYLPKGGAVTLLAGGADASHTGEMADSISDGADFKNQDQSCAALRLSETLSIRVRVSWYDPRSGKQSAYETYHIAGTEADRGTSSVIRLQAPSAGEEQDWILIVTGKENGLVVERREYYHLERAAEEKKVFEW